MDNSLTFAGDVNVETVQIVSLASGNALDVKNQLLAINIYEDLFSPFITGSLSISDSLDLQNALPIIGEELLRLKISTPTFDDETKVIDSEFYIYKMSDREFVNERSVVYSLHFISVEAIRDVNKKLSKAFKGKPDDIISELVLSKNGLESTKKLFFEKSNSKTKFVANFWNPVKAIMYLADRTANIKSTPSYVFFENRDGFNYVSLDFLYSLPVFAEFNYNSFTRQISNNTSSRDIQKDYSRITALSIPTSVNYLEDIRHGKYSSKRLTYDVTMKQYKLQTYDYYQDFSKRNHLNPYPVVSRELISKYNSWLTNNVSHYEVHTGFGDVSEYDTQLRQSLMMQAKSNAIHIEVPGRTDYTVGLKVNLTLYKNTVIKSSDDNESILDKMNSGNYLISAINHTINKTEHTCTMELIKDSLLFDVTKGN